MLRTQKLAERVLVAVKEKHPIHKALRSVSDDMAKAEALMTGAITRAKDLYGSDVPEDWKSLTAKIVKLRELAGAAFIDVEEYLEKEGWE